jgi:hypothetical protein
MDGGLSAERQALYEFECEIRRQPAACPERTARPVWSGEAQQIRRGRPEERRGRSRSCFNEIG